ncbi:putative terpene synthase 2, partial [Mucuna pruriens]
MKHDFLNTQPESLANQLSPSIIAQINHCLRRPFNKNVPRFEVRYHMTLYEEDPSHTKTLLTFAKLDFNMWLFAKNIKQEHISTGHVSKEQRRR